MSADTWGRWAAARPEPRLLHLDSAAAGRSSRATLDAVTSHALLESQVGGYVAQEMAADVLGQLRQDVAGLVGTDTDGVAFFEGGGAARNALLDAWVLPEGARVGVVSAEWGPNLEVFEARGLRPRLLAGDPSGRLDLESLERDLATDPPAVVHLCRVAAHRGLVQPVGQAVDMCHAHGVPVWVDAAQALGHVDVDTGADATYSTSRKWLTGPRGVGMLAVAGSARPRLRVRRPANEPDLPTVQLLESHEAHVAGRVGLAVAVREYLAFGPATVAARLEEVGRLTAQVLAGLSGWEVVGGAAEAGSTGAITALRPTGGQDVVATRTRLLEQHGIVTTVSLPWRAPYEMTQPLLRISPHVDCTTADLGRLRDALAAG